MGMGCIMMKELPAWAPGEEIASTLTHVPGIAFALAAIVLFILKVKDNTYLLVGDLIFAFSMLVMYTASSVYHAIKNENLKVYFRYADHVSIYFLIAGSYSPYCLNTFRSTCGWYIFALIWAFAAVGTFFKIWRFDGFAKLSLFFFIGMGWCVIFAIYDLVRFMEIKGLYWLVVGGLFYTFGCVFFAHDQFPYFHAIWHVFVLLGSISHFICAYYYA